MGLSRSVVPLNKASLKALDVSVKSLNNGVNRTGNITVYSDTLLMFYSFSNDVEKFLDYTQNENVSVRASNSIIKYSVDPQLHWRDKIGPNWAKQTWTPVINEPKK